MKVSIVTPTFNEEANIEGLLERVSSLFNRLEYEYEHIVVDNCSTDKTVSLIHEFAHTNEKNVRVVINSENHGPDYSPMRGFRESTGDVVIPIVADFQDPPEMIEKLIEIYRYSPDTDAVLCIFEPEKGNGVRGIFSTIFYSAIRCISLYEERANFQGFGLYSRKLVDRMTSDPYRFFYFRGLVSKYADCVETISYKRPQRNLGKSSYNWTKLVKHAVVAVNSQNRYFLDFVFIAFLTTFVGFNLQSLGAIAIYYLKNLYTTE